MLTDRNRDSELILGLITTVGTNTDGVISCLKDHLRQFSYTVENISVSGDVIAKFEPAPVFETEYERVSHYMTLGDKIREESGSNSILMEGVSAFLYNLRDITNPQPRKRVAYIIKSLKHPEEVQFMRDVYGDGFHLLGVTSSIDRRIKYLERKGVPNDKARELIDRDANEDIKHGQRTEDAFQQADYFINLTNNDNEMEYSIERLIGLLFGNPFITPSPDEYAMFMAYCTSLRSADLSRQTGAVICKDNEMIAQGVNDCPKAISGGLYWMEKTLEGKYEDIENGRDYKLGYDSNKIAQTKIIEEILKSFGQELNDYNRDKIRSTSISSLTEYGRVVHAEMEALLMCSRNNISCKGATLFATTFPCHNCAKHIIAAGIKKVVYIEPYPKSKAFEFYKKEISEMEEDAFDKVIFTHFVGVGPHRFIDLFAVKSMRSYAKTRKDKEGNVVPWRKDQANLRNPLSRMTYIDSEQAAYDSFVNVLDGIRKR